MTATMQERRRRLTADEQARLVALEAIVTRDQEQFTATALAILEIRRDRLYRDHGSFRRYCTTVLGFRPTTANEWGRTGETIDESEKNGLPAPRTHKETNAIREARRRGRAAAAARHGRAAPDKGRAPGCNEIQALDLTAATQLVDKQVIGHCEALDELTRQHPAGGKASGLLRLLKDLLLPFPPLPTRPTRSGPAPSLRPRGLDPDGDDVRD
ncbi:MAG: hypothetical protein FJ271_28485 [Planctomycetes bacterium]|nr:hypothetical protein [Planctomycetota bacterium]